MELLSLGIILLILVLVILFVTRPLFRNTPDGVTPDALSEEGLAELKYAEVLNLIRELDAENASDKIDADAYAEQRDDLLKQAAGYLEISTNQQKEKDAAKVKE